MFGAGHPNGRICSLNLSGILADEPTGSLDEQNAALVLDILHRINDTGKTIILVTHSKKIIESERKVVRL